MIPRRKELRQALCQSAAACFTAHCIAALAVLACAGCADDVDHPAKRGAGASPADPPSSTSRAGRDASTPLDGATAAAQAPAIQSPPGAVGGAASMGEAGIILAAPEPGDAGADASAASAPPLADGGTTSAGPGGTSVSATPSHPIDCSREGLGALLDLYLGALSAHAPAQLPLAPDLKFTENAVRMQLGDGLWKTAGQLIFRRRAIDTERCGVFGIAVIDNHTAEPVEASGPTLVGVRLQLDELRLTEVESYVVLNASGLYPATDLVSSGSEDWEGVLAPDQRVSREQLRQATDAYFASYSDAAAAVPYGTPCDRRDNGSKQQDCANNLGLGSMHLPVLERRFPIADVEASIAVGFGLHEVAIPGFVLLKLERGKIRYLDSGIALIGQGSTTSGW